MSPRPLITLLALASLLPACRRDDAPSTSPAPAASLAVSAPSAPASVRGPTPAPAPSPDARRAYARHLTAGRTLAGQKRWGEASAELDRALVAIPGDARAMTELGFTLLLSGDVRRSRKVSREGVARASDPALKASALYNLGRADEAEGKREAARKSYTASLELRNSEAVRKQLEGLGKPVAVQTAADPSALPCNLPQPLDELIACIAAAARAEDEDESGLAPQPAELVPPEGDMVGLASRLRVVRAPTAVFGEAFFLVASSVRGWSLVANLGATHNPGAFGINEELSVTKADVRRVKGQSLLWLEATHGRSDSDMGIDEIESAERRDVTLCLLADEKRGQTVCPLARPLSSSFRREKMGLGDVDEETKRLQTPGLPIVRETTFAVTLDGGTVITKLVKGAAEAEDRAKLGAAVFLP